MIKIDRDSAIWTRIEKQHLDFFVSKRKIAQSLKVYREEYEKKTITLLFSNLAKKRLEFLKFLEKEIDKILIGKPDFLRSVISKSESLNIKILKKKFGKNIMVPTKFQARLLTIFDYDNDFKIGQKSKTLGGSSLWTAYNLVDELKINVCPYCNRIYTNTYYSKDEGRTRPHLDHYYSKSIYPFLAISLYNLIPSCYSCNSNFKLDKDFYKEPHFHPYENSMGKNIHFTLEPIKAKIDLAGKKRNGYDLEFTKGKLEAFDLKVDTKKEKDHNLLTAWDNSNKTFHLEEMYQTHKDILHEMIQKSKVYKEEYLDWLDKKYVGSIFKSRAEIEQMITGNYNTERDFEKRPLAKLTYDISKELKILKS